jgi:predicted phage terminase large subunit-like protein
MSSALERVRAERDRRGLGLHDFVMKAWTSVDTAPPCFGRYTRTLCWVLEQVLKGRIRKLIINVPPGHMKSLTVSVFFPAWAWLANPGKRFAFTSYRGELALRDADRSRDLIRSPFYQELLQGRPSDWSLLRAGQDTKSRFANTEGGYRFSSAVSGIMGEGGDIVVIDDPHNIDTAESDLVRDETTRKIRLALPTRVRSKTGAVIVIMQRLHERDLTGVLLAEESGLWTHLNLPARYEKSWIDENGERKGHPHPCAFDWRKTEGELLFPELFDRKRLDELTIGLTEYGEAGQLQQRPHPREGGMFKRADFKFIDASEVPKGGTRVRGWDLAATASTAPNAAQAAWTVGLLIRYVERKIIIEDVVRLRGSPHKVRTTMRNVGDQDGRSVIIDFPQDPGQAGKAQAEDIAADFPRHRIKFSPESGDKAVRAEAPADQVEAGNVYLVRAPWNGIFLDELGSFPGSTFADQVDAFSRAYHRAVRQPKRARSGSLKGAA